MVFATEVMTVLILVSFSWMVRSFSKNRSANLVCCLLLVSSIISPDGPCSENGQLFFLQASYYACYLITLFVVFGDYIRACYSSQPRRITLALAVILSFTTGMQSLRQTVVMVLPIIAFELFQMIRKKLYWEASWNLRDSNRILRIGSYTVANIAGAITARLLNVPHSTIFRNYPPVNQGNPLGWVYAIWDALKGVTGLNFAFTQDYYPVITIFALFIVLIFFVACFCLIPRLRHTLSGLEICWLLCFIGMVGVAMSSLVLNIKLRPIYFFTWFPLVALSGLLIWNKLHIRSKIAATILLCFLSIGNLYRSYFPYMTIALWQGPTQAEQLCQWAVEENYEYIYGGWFTAPPVAAYSGGNLTAGYWWPTYLYQPLGYINSDDIYDTEKNEKAIYVFTDSDEKAGLLLAQERGVTLTKVAEFEEYFVYTSPVPLMDGQPRSYEDFSN